MSDYQDSKECRRHRRYPFLCDITIDGTIHYTTTDISESGLFASAIENFSEDRIVRVTIPFQGQKITVKAKVTYAQAGIGIGLMFIDLTDEQQARITELVETIARQNG